MKHLSPEILILGHDILCISSLIHSVTEISYARQCDKSSFSFSAKSVPIIKTNSYFHG